VIPAIRDQDGNENVSLSIITANFPKAQGDKPALFKRSDVRTFFHEFGHALHTLFGRTTLASLSGTRVKRDFVELPSQMLEEWLYDKAILRLVSSHYETSEPLPDEMIDRVLQLKNIGSGSFVQRQGLFAKLSLAYFAPGADKNVDDVYRCLREKIIPNVVYVPEDHMYAAFGHLTNYGAKYYGYLWSKVFAQDLFAEIKKHGLLNPEIGKKYVDLVIGRGGSADPNALLKDFLGREPNDKAFFEDMKL
jgi:thimet oligopeptidase